MAAELLSAAGIAVITVVVVFVAVTGIGFWLLARRRAGGLGTDAAADLQQKANILLVRADDAVRNAEDELGFALAQFGPGRTVAFQETVESARAQLREAFGLQQKLDDAFPDTETQRRDWTARIIHLCETARTALAAQEQEFAALRNREKSAPEDLAAVRVAIDGLGTLMATSAATLSALRSDYADSAISTVADNLERAGQERDLALTAADRAQELLDTGRRGTGSGSAIDLLRTAQEHAHRSGQFLGAIDTLRDELGKASEAVTVLRESTRRNLAEARAMRDSPPDAETSAAVDRAIQAVEKALAAHWPPADPLAGLEALRAANAQLDAGMAGARNQQRRLDGASTALVGALVGARSQLTATRDFIATRRGGVGAEARTRLAEAERLLLIAEAETDPVAALDTARSSATYSRDADALARYDLRIR